MIKIDNILDKAKDIPITDEPSTYYPGYYWNNKEKPVNAYRVVIMSITIIDVIAEDEESARDWAYDGLHDSDNYSGCQLYTSIIEQLPDENKQRIIEE